MSICFQHVVVTMDIIESVALDALDRASWRRRLASAGGLCVLLLAAEYYGLVSTSLRSKYRLSAIQDMTCLVWLVNSTDNTNSHTNTLTLTT